MNKMRYEDFEKEFIKMSPELYRLINLVEDDIHDYIKVMGIMGGKSVYDDISEIYNNSVEDPEFFDRSDYRGELIKYFKMNSHKHNDWIEGLKFHLL